MSAHPEGRIRVLLIDDEPEFLDLIKFFLDRDGSIDVTLASSAKDGLGILQEGAIDAVVSDYSMPDMDGLEMLKIVRAGGNDIPFILLTGKGREDVAIEALNSGADFYVRKGTDPKTQFAEIINSIRIGVDRKRAEEAASESSRFMARVINSIRDGICVLDRNRTVVMANTVIEEWYSHLQPIVGKKCWEVFLPTSESRHDMVCPGKRTIETGEVTKELIPRLDADGNRIGWIEMFSFPLIKGEPAQVDGVIEYARDITELHAMREDIMEELATLEALDSVTRALICPPSTIREISKLVLDSAKNLTDSEHGYVSSIDPVTKSCMSWTITDMFGKECSVADESIEFRIGPNGQYPRIWGHALNTREPFISNNPEEHELYVGVPEGHIKLRNFLSVPVIIGDELVGVISLANSSRDYGKKDIGVASRLAQTYALAIIHERDVAALREMEARFRLFMDNTPMFAFMKDSEGRYVYANRHYLESLAKAEEEVIGSTDLDIWPEESARRFRRDDAKVLAGEDDFKTTETVRKEDGLHEYLTLKFPMGDRITNPGMVGGVSIDITDIRRAEEALRTANEKLRMLGSLTRHDALNQITVLEGWRSIIAGSGDREEILVALSKMAGAVKALRAQMEFAGEYERIGTVPLEWIGLHDAFCDALTSVDVGHIEIVSDVRDIEVLADPMFSKVFQNLLSNSIRHGERVTRIVVSTEETTDSLKIRYEDDGIGIPPKVKDTIFELAAGGSAGHGLYLVRELLKTGGMTIKEAGEYGEGVVFEIDAPIGSYRSK